MKCQVDKTQHFGCHSFFAFNPGVKAVEATSEIYAVYGEKAMSQTTFRLWFLRFKNGLLKEGSHTVRPIEFGNQSIDQYLSVHKDSFSNPTTNRRLEEAVVGDWLKMFKFKAL
ncbi:hypothetical protein AVEN_48924-1 [Araneus ventricosus]|uniref:Mos1 transposase HTH domain-containing protein n=1 Tax=Araneus ventricosus TaxID=182803 RepID=A0A4Y2AH62_ARAVE|nr:hypothetical protein AVEN_48924-1 [Araneus ventricosus]